MQGVCRGACMHVQLSAPSLQSSIINESAVIVRIHSTLRFFFLFLVLSVIAYPLHEGCAKGGRRV